LVFSLPFVYCIRQMNKAVNSSMLGRHTATLGEAGLVGLDHIALVVLNIYAATSAHLYAYLSEGANVSAPDPAYADALELFENTRLGGSVIWINAEGVTLDELALLEKQWLPIAGKAIMLIGSNQVPVINRSLQGLMAARRENTAFEAMVLTSVDAAIASTTCRLMASQSAGWLRHETKDAKDPMVSIIQVMGLLGLTSAEKAIAAPIPDVQISQQAPADDSSFSPLSSSTPTLTLTLTETEGTSQMATLNDSMNACMQIDGAMAAALVDMGSGMALAKVGGGVNLDVAAAGNTEVLKSKLKTMASLGLKDAIEDVLITLGTQYHLIRPIPHKQGLFLYLVLDKTKGNLAMARFKLMAIEKDITV
jgi:hypothetical protein